MKMSKMAGSIVKADMNIYLFHFVVVWAFACIRRCTCILRVHCSTRLGRQAVRMPA